MKICCHCKEEKPLAEFYAYRARGGYQAQCKACTRKRADQWYSENPERLKQSQARYAKTHSAERAAATALWYSRNKKRNHANTAAWYRRHPERGAQKTALYRVAIAKARVKWANDFFISEAYALAALRSKMLGYQWSVDHIVPLKHSLVCGLHVENNLRVIPAVRNSAKGNRHWPDMP